VCTSSYLNLHIPAERKRRADEAQQSSMGNGASAENGATAVTFSFFPPPLFLVHTSVCVCIIFALSGIMGGPIRYLSLLTLMWRNVYLLQWLCDCCFRTTISAYRYQGGMVYHRSQFKLLHIFDLLSPMHTPFLLCFPKHNLKWS
jgi:hypothetical protein